MPQKPPGLRDFGLHLEGCWSSIKSRCLGQPWVAMCAMFGVYFCATFSKAKSNTWNWDVMMPEKSQWLTISESLCSLAWESDQELDLTWAEWSEGSVVSVQSFVWHFNTLWKSKVPPAECGVECASRIMWRMDNTNFTRWASGVVG